MYRFLKSNLRWLAAGFLLLFASSFGQTFFISLSGGEIRQQFGLSNGAFGSLYMAATLASALTLVRLGQIVDSLGTRRVVAIVVPMLALGALGLALSPNLPLLFLSLYLLRLFGQGMMVHTAYTKVGRWFAAGRGRAVSISALGLNAGQAMLPIAFVALAALVGWRNVWLVASAFLLAIILPLGIAVVRAERVPEAADLSSRAGKARDWTRSQALRDPFFYLLLLGMLPPAFISNTIFFHQVHLAEMRGWPPEVFASGFAIYAGITVLFALIAGQLVDRFSALALLPFYLLPFGLACLLLGNVEAAWAVFAFMALYGISDGFSLTLFGSLWPEVYGTRYLGAIRAALVAIMAFASAAGPGIAGLLIDFGIPFPAQIAAIGVYCVAICFVMHAVAQRVAARLAPAQ